MTVFLRVSVLGKPWGVVDVVDLSVGFSISWSAGMCAGISIVEMHFSLRESSEGCSSGCFLLITIGEEMFLSLLDSSGFFTGCSFL